MFNIYIRKSIYHYCSKYCLNKHAIDYFQFQRFFFQIRIFHPKISLCAFSRVFRCFHTIVYGVWNIVAPQNIYVAISLMFGPKTGYFDWPNRCAGGLKKKLDLRSDSQRHRHFVGSFNVPVQAPTRDHPFYTVIPRNRPI